MKKLSVLALCLLLNSCNSKSTPIESGYVESGTIWEYPIGTSLSNSGGSIKEGSAISIYENVAIIHADEGKKLVIPLSRISDLKISH